MYPFRIACRYLFARKTHSAVNIISAISAVVVAVASAAIVVVLSVFNGFEDLAKSHLSVLDPQLKVAAMKGKTISDADSLARVISDVAAVAAAMPVVEERGLLVDGGHQHPVVFKGVPDDYSAYTGIDSAMVDGFFMMSAGRYALSTFSAGTAYNLGLRPDAEKVIGLYVPRRVGRISTANPATAFRGDSLLMSGVFQVNQPEYDNDHIFIPLSRARALLEYDSEATAIEVALREDADLKEAAKAIASVVGPDFRVLDRMQQQEASFHMIEIEKWVTFMMLAFILLVASFNIISTIGMLVLDKRDNLHTLRALGASRRDLGNIFVWQGWLITAIGGAAGIIIGTGLVLAQQYGGFIKLNADPSVLTVAEYPVRLAAPDLIYVAAIVALIGFLTSRATTFFIKTSNN